LYFFIACANNRSSHSS